MNNKEWTIEQIEDAGYEIWPDGTIISKRGKEPMKPFMNEGGYLLVGIYINGKRRSMRVHRLVAMKYLPNPGNLPAVNHMDESKTNNHMDNLEWLSIGDNNRYGTAIARRSKPILQLTATGDIIQKWPSTAEAQRNGFVSGAISNVCLGKSQSHAGYGWCFADEYQEAA